MTKELNALNGLVEKLLLHKHMTLQFPVIILTTRITCAFGVHVLTTNLTSISSTKVTTSEQSVSASLQSILQVCFTLTTRVIKAKSCVWSNSTFSVPHLFVTLFEDTRRLTATGQSLQNWIRFNSTILILQSVQLSCLEFYLMRKNWATNSLGTLSTTLSRTQTIQSCQKHWRSGLSIWSADCYLDTWTLSTWSTTSI